MERLEDLVNHIDNLFLHKNFVSPEERNAKLQRFNDMFKRYTPELLIKSFRDWSENFSSKLGSGKDFFDDLSRFKAICDRPESEKWKPVGDGEYRRLPTREFHDAIAAINVKPHKNPENKNWKTNEQCLVEWYDKTYIKPAIKQHIEKRLELERIDMPADELRAEGNKRYCYYCDGYVVRPNISTIVVEWALYYECQKCDVKFEIQEDLPF